MIGFKKSYRKLYNSLNSFQPCVDDYFPLVLLKYHLLRKLVFLHVLCMRHVYLDQHLSYQQEDTIVESHVTEKVIFFLLKYNSSLRGRISILIPNPYEIYRINRCVKYILYCNVAKAYPDFIMS